LFRLTLGDVVPEEILQKMLPTKAQAERKSEAEKAADEISVMAAIPPFLQRHSEEVVLPLMQSYLNYLRSDPAHKKIGSIGFCWGGRYSILLANEGANPSVDAAVANHPSFLKMPEEIEKIEKPVSIHVGDADVIFKMPDVETTREIFKTKPHCEIYVYEDQVHGFTIRSDLSIEKDKKAKEKAAERVIPFYFQVNIRLSNFFPSISRNLAVSRELNSNAGYQV
jgi:dienelactone hydrolase